MRPVSDPAATPDRYRAFAEIEARGQSPVYEEWALGVADDPRLVALIDELPGPKRQVNLVFSAARAAGAEAGGFPSFRDWLVENWPAVRAIALARSTQTNEAGRCAILLPLLARLPQPLALLEVGASAGLCLYPDRYSYRYGEHEVHPADGPSAVVLAPRVSGPVPVPDRMPEVVWRAGVDLNPLDPADPADTRWLESLIWPEHHERRARLSAALAIARDDPPTIVRGDAVGDLPALAAQAPPGATLVVFHSAVLAYLEAGARRRFAEQMRTVPAEWISNEGSGVVPGVDAVPPDPSLFVVAHNGEARAFAGGHGQELRWIG